MYNEGFAGSFSLPVEIISKAELFTISRNFSRWLYISSVFSKRIRVCYFEKVSSDNEKKKKLIIRRKISE